MIFVILLLACGLVASYFVILPSVDQAFCIPQVAKRVGASGGYSELLDYVEAHLTPSMTRSQVMQELEKLGTVEVDQGTAVVGGVVSDTLRIHICPFTTIQVFANYTVDGHLKFVGVRRD